MQFTAESYVCVCSGTSCDFPGDIAPPADTSSFVMVTSSQSGGRFDVVNPATSSTPTVNATVLRLNPTYQYQTMHGFGGAFTDSAGINIAKLSNDSQDTLIRSYFAPEGIRYDLCRVPIAGSDFSVRPYSYDDVDGDVNLDFFALAEEDYMYKLPYIRKAIEVMDAERELLLFGSPWAPPAWMKESGMTNGSGGLLREMWTPYANYFVKFIEAYEAEGAPIWGVTTQNEPLTGYEDWMWNTCLWTAEDMRDWLKADLGPIMNTAGFADKIIMVLDHNRDALPWYPKTILEDPEANQYVDGTAVHWYDDANSYPNLMSETHDLFPDKFILYTEACEGWNAPSDSRVVLGSWERAQNYAYNIIDDVTHFSTGWVDWNMALDMGGGPNWANNFVDAPIIIDAASDRFYKQPMFYVMGHFSKFIVPGGKAIYSSVVGDYNSIRAAAFVNPDGYGVAVVLNTNDNPVDVTVQPLVGTEYYLNVEMEGKSINTFLFNIPANPTTYGVSHMLRHNILFYKPT